MTTNSIDLTGLTPQQINQIKAIVQEFRDSSRQPPEKLTSRDQFPDDKELEKLEHEFDWLVADLGVKMPLTRSQIYDS